MIVMCSIKAIECEKTYTLLLEPCSLEVEGNIL